MLFSQPILKHNAPYLFDLIGFSLGSSRLQVNDFFDPFFCKNKVISSDTFIESGSVRLLLSIDLNSKTKFITIYK